MLRDCRLYTLTCALKCHTLVVTHHTRRVNPFSIQPDIARAHQISQTSHPRRDGL